MIEIHGTLYEVECLGCDARTPMRQALERVARGEADPACEACGGILKSATISFGQPLDPEVIDRAQIAAMECDLFLAIGTTLSVYPVANTVPRAKRHGAQVIILNGTPTEMDDLADVLLQASIGDVLPLIIP